MDVKDIPNLVIGWIYEYGAGGGVAWLEDESYVLGLHMEMIAVLCTD